MVVDQDDREVHDVKDDSKKPPGKSRRGNGKHNQTKKPSNCRRCGKVHQSQKCPTYGQVCHTCKQRNNYSKMCQPKPRDSSKQVSEFTCDDSDTDELFIGVLGTTPLTRKDWMQSVVINKLQVNMKLDTGAQCLNAIFCPMPCTVN